MRNRPSIKYIDCWPTDGCCNWHLINSDVSYEIFDKISNIEYFEIQYVAGKNITSLNTWKKNNNNTEY